MCPSFEEEVKQAQTEMKKAFEEFKSNHTKELEELKKKGSVDPLVKESVEKANKGVSDLEKKIEDIQVAMKRVAADNAKGEKLEKAKAFAIAHKGEFPTLFKGDMIDVEKSAKYKELMENFLRKGEHVPAELKALSSGSNPDGGYFVRPELAAEIQEKLFESSPLRQLASVQTIGSNQLDIDYTTGEAEVVWVGETEDSGETDSSTTSQVSIFAHKMQASPKATQDLLDDAAVDIEAWHADQVRQAMARKEATAFISGTGVKQPKGILGYTSGTGFDQLEQVVSGTSGEFTADGLIDVQNSLFEEFQTGAIWLMRRASTGAVRKLKDGNGRYLWAPLDTALIDGPQAALLGKPVYFAADMEAIGASSLSAAYGDFRRGYQIVDRVGIRVLRDPYTAKPYVLFSTTKRVGGGVKHFQAIKIHKLST